MAPLAPILGQVNLALDVDQDTTKEAGASGEAKYTILYVVTLGIVFQNEETVLKLRKFVKGPHRPRVNVRIDSSVPVDYLQEKACLFIWQLHEQYT